MSDDKEPFDWTIPHTQEEYEEENARIFAQRLADTIDAEILEDVITGQFLAKPGSLDDLATTIGRHAPKKSEED